MRGLALSCGLLLLAGCLSPGPTHGHASDNWPGSSAPSGISPDAAPTPGMFDVVDGGLQPLDQVPGLTAKTDGASTSYSWDLREALLDDGDPLLLVQALADETMQVSYDVDVAYVPPAVAGSDFERPDAVCLGTSMTYDEGEHGFYLARALGQSAAPPVVDGQGGFQGDAIGHGRAGPTDLVVQVFGDRFTESEQDTFRVASGGFVRMSNQLSQLAPRNVAMPGNHWLQNWTVDGPHRIIRIPPAPVFCATGFGEFTDATVVGKAPLETTLGGHLDLQTRYGSTVVINNGYAPTDDAPGNSASVDFLGRHCQVGAGKGVSLSSFDAGAIHVAVDRWVGSTFMVVLGSGPAQQYFGTWGDGHCES